MKPYIKPIDGSGRVVIPKPVLYASGIEPSETVEIYFEHPEGQPARIIVEKHKKVCKFCKNIPEQGETFVEKGGKSICEACIKEISEEYYDPTPQSKKKNKKNFASTEEAVRKRAPYLNKKRSDTNVKSHNTDDTDADISTELPY